MSICFNTSKNIFKFPDISITHYITSISSRAQAKNEKHFIAPRQILMAYEN